MAERSCVGCIYARILNGEEGDDLLKCLRYPAQIRVLDDEWWQGYPDAYHRCGEYKTDRMLEQQGITNPFTL